jgi:hypothetical protein
MQPNLKADCEALYQTVYRLEGVRHPVESPEELDRAADFIAARMKSYGLQVREQLFFIDGWNRPFRNIEGSLGPVGDKPAAALTAHYDSVATTLGANDDAAGVAIILEAGRLLAQIDDPPPVYIVAVSLEESSNPLFYTRIISSAIRHGVIDGKKRYLSWAAGKAAKAINGRAIEIMNSGKTQAEGYRQALDEQGNSLPANLRAHYEEIIPLFAEVTVASSIGQRSRVGSHRWVQEALQTGKQIAFNINVDEPGIFRYEARTQGLLGGRGFEMFNEHYRLDAENAVGNFIMVVSNQSSAGLGALYAEHCKSEGVNLPYGWARLPLDYEQIVANLPMALNSDHASFWQAGIPALFLFDSSTARDPYVHTMADTIDQLDFDRMADIAQSLAATLADPRAYPSGE